MTDFKQQLWRDVLMSGIEGMAGGRNIGANDCVYIADEMVKRYLDRFEPDADDDALMAAMDADRARVLAELDAAKAKATEVALAKHKAEGPWATGATLLVKATSNTCVVVEDTGGAQVRVRYPGGGKGKLLRNAVEWVYDPEPAAAEAEAPDDDAAPAEEQLQ